MKNFWKTLPAPIIGLSPMDGYTDSAMRHICKDVNPDIITYTEFTSADGLHHGAERVKMKLAFTPSEQPIIAQIFGKDVDAFITAAKWCEEQGFAGIDLNMGCPSKKVVKSEQGVALRRCSDLAFRLVEAVATNTTLPVSVKTRLGWSDASDLVSFGIGVQNAGSDMICIHARTYKEPYNVPAQWEPVYELKRALNIPVIGNGGIISIEDGMSKLGNLDGFLIGQAAIGNPWVFDPNGAPQSIVEKIPLIKAHTHYLIASKGERVGTQEIRKYLLAYIKQFPGSRAYRSQFARVASLDEIMALLDEVATIDDQTSVPVAGFFSKEEPVEAVS